MKNTVELVDTTRSIDCVRLRLRAPTALLYHYCAHDVDVDANDTHVLHMHLPRTVCRVDCPVDHPLVTCSLQVSSILQLLSSNHCSSTSSIASSSSSTSSPPLSSTQSKPISSTSRETAVSQTASGCLRQQVNQTLFERPTLLTTSSPLPLANTMNENRLELNQLLCASSSSHQPVFRTLLPRC